MKTATLSITFSFNFVVNTKHSALFYIIGQKRRDVFSHNATQLRIYFKFEILGPTKEPLTCCLVVQNYKIIHENHSGSGVMFLISTHHH